MIPQFFALVGLTALLFFLANRYAKKSAPLPPGPPADPLIGHIRLIPPDDQGMFFYKLGKRYGDVVHLKVLNKTLIILNSVEAAVELLDKRSMNNSDRPALPVYNLLGTGESFAFMEYGKKYRTERR